MCEPTNVMIFEKNSREKIGEKVADLIQISAIYSDKITIPSAGFQEKNFTFFNFH
jgi:hypothetical protein